MDKFISWLTSAIISAVVVGILNGIMLVISMFSGPVEIPTLAHLEPLPEHNPVALSASYDGPIDFRASVGYAEKVQLGMQYIDDRR